MIKIHPDALEAAIEMVLKLARKQAKGPQEVEAINTIEDFFVNEVWG